MAANSAGRFYAFFNDFLDRCDSIHRGEFPEIFYLVESDYRAGEPESSVPHELAPLRIICELIQLLTKLSLGGDLLSMSPRPAQLLKDLLKPEAEHTVRNEEYKAMLRLAMADEIVGETAPQDRFHTLVERWQKMMERFQYDVQCLVDGLSFESLRIEMIEAELNFFGKINGRSLTMLRSF
ncbi:MAG TPA: hypothetical protein ACQGQH_10070 [Xylella sp.]